MRQDFILDEDGDFPLEDTIIAGVYLDTPYGNSDNQHHSDITVYEYGWLKQYPVFGFGIYKYLNAEVSLQTIENKFNQEIEKDSYGSRNGAIAPDEKGFKVFFKFIYPK